MINVDSTIKDVWETPAGHDILKKILRTKNIPEKTVLNPLTMRLKLSQLGKVFGNKIDPNFLMAMIHLINMHPELPQEERNITPTWWREAVCYRIDLRNFTAANGTIGLPAVIGEMEHLKELGVDALWLSPIFDASKESGAVRDFRAIQKEYGSFEDFDKLLTEAHNRNIKVVLELSVTHTSKEHPWFQKAITDPDDDSRDYYFLQDPDALNEPPNNWSSRVSGSAWSRYGEDQLWGLHLLSEDQPELNWDNDTLREEIYEMLRFWLKKGVDGFSLKDVNFLSKEEGLPDGDETVGRTIGYTGMERYFCGPKIHTYLRELYEKVFAPYNALFAGSTPELGTKMLKQFTGKERNELHLAFSDEPQKQAKNGFDLNHYRDRLLEWTESNWLPLYYESDLCERITKDPALQQRAATLLAVLRLTLRGTPFFTPADEKDPALYNVCHDLIALRKQYSTLIYGEVKLLNQDRDHLAFARFDKNGLFVIDCNLSGHKLPSVFRRDGFAREFAPAYLESGRDYLSPYEARIFRKE